METNATKPAGPVPDELIEKFHRANEHFHEARENLEEQMRGTDHRHQQRVNAATDGVQAAEREVEEITDKITQELHAQEPGSQVPTGEAPRAVLTERDEHVADFEPLR